MDQYKGFTHLGRQQDQAPRLGLLYSAVIPFLAGAGFVAWLGWDWQALIALVAALVIGTLVFRNASRRGSGRRRGGSTSSAHYNDARTNTVEQQTRMHLDSKGPLGF
jgi:membrane protein implicated in regulation of membrane protease activity